MVPTKTALVAIFFTLLCNPLRLVAEDVVSMGIGFGAAQQIATSTEWQEKLDVTPEQLERLRKFLKSQELILLQAKHVSKFAFGSLLHKDQDELEAANRFFSEGIVKVLDREQLNARRKFYFQKRFPFPLEVVNSNLFEYVGLSAEAVSAIILETSRQAREFSVLAEEIREKAIVDTVESSPKFIEKIVECFGESSLPESVKSNAKFNSDSFGVLDVDTGFGLATSAVALNLHSNAKPLTDDQRTTILNLDRQVQFRRAKQRNFNADRALIEGVANVLDKSQLDALKEAMHVAALRSNLNVLSSPNVLTYMRATAEEAATVAAICSQRQSEIVVLRRKRELTSFHEFVSTFPSDKAQKTMELLEGVWPKD